MRSVQVAHGGRGGIYDGRVRGSENGEEYSIHNKIISRPCMDELRAALRTGDGVLMWQNLNRLHLHPRMRPFYNTWSDDGLVSFAGATMYGLNGKVEHEINKTRVR